MAYVNVKDWSVEQVTDWLKGINNVINPYTKSFLNNGVNGYQLLNLRVDDLEHLGVSVLGHQEIILESVEHLRNFHYELDKENLQMLALRLSCAANSLNRELQYHDENSKMVQTQTLSDVNNITSTIKPLVCWLDRSPFLGDKDYNEMKKNLLQFGFEMATCAHRDIFSEKPIKSIRDICEKLTKLADKIIQEISDPMILQPASLDLTTLKKKEQELGFFILPSNNAVHQIAEIKYGSPAHMSTKIEEGDEIVQVNYQTVVGWQRKKVMLLLQESPPEIVLTLKKRPRHTKVYGQIYMKPYRLPSKKRAPTYSRWNENLPSPRLLTIDFPQITIPKNMISSEIIESDDTESSSSSDSEQIDCPLTTGGRLYPLKPRAVLQRRNTIAGATPSNIRPSQAVDPYWRILKNQATTTHSSSYNLQNDKFDDDSMYIRDKSVSCSHGLELTQRPKTTIGLGLNRKSSFKTNFQDKCKKNVNFDDTKTVINDEIRTDKKSISTNSLSSLKDESIDFIDESDDLQDRSKMSISEEEVEDLNVSDESSKSNRNGIIKDSVFDDVHIDNIIKKFDQKLNENKPKVLPRTSNLKSPAVPQKPAALPRTMVNRGRLDKSHSTPTYDEEPPLESVQEIQTNFESVLDTPIKYELGIPIVHNSPPIIEKNRFQVPPKPPPRTNLPDVIKKAEAKTLNKSEVKTDFNAEKFISSETLNFEPPIISTPIVKQFKEDILKVDSYNGNKLHKTSPSNYVVRAIYSSKNKSGKKKNSLLAKRRKVSVNDVSPGEIQGYLFQRLRSKQTVQWEKRWFVLNNHCLYGFKSKESSKAEFFIYLSGFTATVASEVKSRSHAFKVYHTGTVFYFSAENEEVLTSWLEIIAVATLNTDATSIPDQILYSETDDEYDDETSTKPLTEKPTERKFNSLKKFSSKKRNDSSENGSTSLDRKWFFNKSNSPKSSLPVPTAQFRSYRKIPASTKIGNFTSHVPSFSSKIDINASMDSIPIPQEMESFIKPKLNNHLHASNPSLCNAEYNAFQYITRPIHHENFTGFLTLKELMNSESDDKKDLDDLPPINPNLIRPDVVYGEIPIRPVREAPEYRSHTRTASDSSEHKKESSCFGKRSSSIKSGNHSFNVSSFRNKTNNSLPRTAKLEHPFKQKSNSSKSLFKTEEKSYEMIFCPQTTADVQFAQNRSLDSRLQKSVLKSAGQYTPMALPLTPDEKFSPKFAFELNLDERSSGHKGGKFKQFFMKQDSKKEKKSSSRVPRGTTRGDNDISWPSQGCDDSLGSNDVFTVNDSAITMSPQATDYPGLEYPPVFEPETYSLLNPQGSLFRKALDKNN